MSHIRWQGHTPVSEQFDDVYYSAHDGLAESQYVFLQHNHLVERWAAKPRHFTIAESGFGTGLNFLAAWQQWQHEADTTQHLHFISFEKYPLDAEQIQHALSHWPELADLSHKLVSEYPAALHHGVHHRHWIADNISLTLYIGDIAEHLPQLQTRSIDAWFLDGFAPARNPDMWSDDLFTHVTRSSKLAGTFATFTAAGFVRRALIAAGWAAEKVPGIGHKREMLRGALHEEPAPVPPLKKTPAYQCPWFQYPNNTVQTPQTIAIIGAGLAGCATAWSLAKRGHAVTLIDAAGICGGASGIPVGVLRPHPDAGNSLASQFYWHAWQYATQILTQLKREHALTHCERTGAVHVATSPDEAIRQQKLVDQWHEYGLLEPISNEQLTNLFDQVDLDTAGLHGGILYPDAYTLKPASLCNALVDHDNITLVTERVASIEKHEGSWQCELDDGTTLKVDNVILASGASAPLRDEISALNLQALRGQLSRIPMPINTAQPLCYEGYLSPVLAGEQYMGASYQVGDYSTDLRQTEHQHNISLLRKVSPALATQLHAINADTSFQGFVGTRMAARDHVPVVGAVPDSTFYTRRYQGINQPRPLHASYPAAHYVPGLYLNIGHASRGLSSTLLSGEILSALIDGRAVPTGRDVLQLLHPARFIIRQLKKGLIP